MSTMQQWFDEYSQSHRHKTNKLIYWICVPFIFFSVIGPAWLPGFIYRKLGIPY